MIIWLVNSAPPPRKQWGLNDQNILILLSFFRLGVFGYFTLLNETAPGNLGLRDIMLGRSHHLLSVSRCKTPLANTDWQSWAHKSHFWFGARVTGSHINMLAPRNCRPFRPSESRYTVLTLPRHFSVHGAKIANRYEVWQKVTKSYDMQRKVNLYSHHLLAQYILNM